MLKYLTLAFDYVWNLKALEGIRHKLFRYVGIGLAGYNLLSTSKEFGHLPDVPEAYLSAFLLWLATKGIQFAKTHQP